MPLKLNTAKDHLSYGATPASTVSHRSYSAVNVASITAESTGTTVAAGQSSGGAAHALRIPATPAAAAQLMRPFWSR